MREVKFVTIRHDELGLESEVHPDSVAVWKLSGWHKVTKKTLKQGADKRLKASSDKENE